MTGVKDLIQNNVFIVGENISRYKFTQMINEGVLSPVHHTNTKGGDPVIVYGIGISSSLTPSLRKQVIRQLAPRIAMRMIRSPGIGLNSVSALTGGLAGDILHLVNLTDSKRQARIIGEAFVMSFTKHSAAPSFKLGKQRIKDHFGSFECACMPFEGIFLTSFAYENRKRERHILRPIISTDERVSMLRKLVSKHDGDMRLAWKSVWHIAKSLNLGSQEINQARAFFVQNSRGVQATFPNIHLDVAIAGLGRIGQISTPKQKLDDEAAWRQDNYTPMKSLGSAATYRFPIFLETLLPERLGVADDSDRSRIYPLFERYQRYTNNITIYDAKKPLDKAVFDFHEASICQFSDNQSVFRGRFIEKFNGPPSEILNWIAKNSELPEQPAIPGMQDKAALSLSGDGELSLVDSSAKAFTHILKFGSSPQMEVIQAGEWYCSHLLRAAGIRTATSALLDLAPGAPLCLVSERFDIPFANDKSTIFSFEDGCAITAIPIHKKYAVPLELLARKMVNQCESMAEAEQILRLVMASYFVGNTDAHARNFGLLTKEKDGLSVCQMAPAYDVICSIGMPWISSSPALPINKSRAYTMDSFRFLGGQIGISGRRVDDLAAEVNEQMKRASSDLLANLPIEVSSRPKALEHIKYIDRLVGMAANHLDLSVSTQNASATVVRAPKMK